MRRTKRNFAASAAVTALVLGGCSLPVKEVSDPGVAQSAQSAQSGETAGDLTLTEAQAVRIVNEIQSVLDTAEADDDTDILPERLTNPALKMRKAQFTLAKKTKTDLRPLLIEPSVFSATVGDSWPRVLVVATETDGEEPTELFFITQQEARADYMLENWTRLVGGTSVKGVSIRDGSKVLEADAPGLKMTPEEAVNTYVNHLNSPKNKEYKVYEDDVFGPRYREELKTLNDAVEVAGEVRAKARTNKNPIIGVALSAGGALVSASFNYQTVYERTVPGSTFELAGTPAAYLKDKEVIGSVTVKYLVTVFFLIPPEGSDEDISVVGSERVITSVSRDDTEPEEEEDAQ